MNKFVIDATSSAEDIFRHACEVLLAEDFQQCLNERGQCTYEAADGSNCVVGGMLRKDWLRSEWLAKDKPIDDVVNDMYSCYDQLSPRDAELLEALHPHVWLLEELQMVHDEPDGSDRASRARCLYEIAEKMDIKVAVYDYVST